MSVKAANENPDAAEELSEMNCGSDIDDKLASIQCPFTWMKNWKERYVAAEHEEIIQVWESQQLRTLEDRKEYFPEIVLTFHLNKAFKKATINQLTEAIEHLNNAESTLADLKQNGTLKNVQKALDHIFIGTKCHVLRKQGHQAKVVELLEQIRYVEDMNNIELAMLSGCRCSALSLTDSDYTERIKAAKEAIEYEPDNGKWHFMLAKEYRKLRRNKPDLAQVPDDNEISAFEEAYKLWKNPLFCVSLAQLYRECRQNTRANEIYKEVYALKPKSRMIQLQLALGFIRANECILAKNCLEYVAEKMPDACRYTHYMAIYEEKCNKDLQAALPYYKSTTEMLNSTAEVQYMECRKKVEPEWDPLPYLLDLEKRYDQFSPMITQPFYIYIGSHYLYEMRDVLSASKYLIKAIEINPKMKQLKDHRLLFRSYRKVNIYHTLAQEVGYALQKNASTYDENEIKILKDTLQLCRDNCEDLSSKLFQSQTPFWRSQPSASFGNYGRTVGSSSHVDNSNWRQEQWDMPCQSFSNYRSSRSGRNTGNSSSRNFSSSRERDYTSWRSEGKAIQSNRNNTYSSTELHNEEDSVLTDRVKSRSNRYSDTNERGGAKTSCHLAETMRDCNL